MKYGYYFTVGTDGKIIDGCHIPLSDLETVTDDFKHNNVIIGCETCPGLMRYSKRKRMFICDECQNFLYEDELE